MAPTPDIIAQLSAVLEARKSQTSESSYVAGLYAGGLNKILEKVGEEATEVVLAARDLAQGRPLEGTKSDNRPGTAELEAALVSEVADLWFHSMVMLTHQDVPPGKVLDELARRFGVSGIEEKQSR